MSTVYEKIRKKMTLDRLMIKIELFTFQFSFVAEIKMHFNSEF